ncbi:hypothetical protein F0562_012003 [Nyssa sinensis]|uniref:Uncharacterized protein n=1 Tax=Nyssa sinensis TaxID=561372 RepID=A0A5J4ZSC5_9ASTE|nr:hypothetical protein F0562_012003 [Nyssa sinensis]
MNGSAGLRPTGWIRWSTAVRACQWWCVAEWRESSRPRKGKKDWDSRRQTRGNGRSHGRWSRIQIFDGAAMGESRCFGKLAENGGSGTNGAAGLNLPLYQSATARTCHHVIQGREFWPKRPIDEPLVREFYTNLEIVHNQITVKAFVCGIAFDLMLTLIVETLGIPWEDQPSFPYPPSVAPREEVLARALHHDRSEVFKVIGAEYPSTHIQAIHEHQDQFAASLSTMATDLHSLIPDDDDGEDSDDGDFTPDTSAT